MIDFIPLDVWAFFFFKNIHWGCTWRAFNLTIVSQITLYWCSFSILHYCLVSTEWFFFCLDIKRFFKEILFILFANSWGITVMPSITTTVSNLKLLCEVFKPSCLWLSRYSVSVLSTSLKVIVSLLGWAEPRERVGPKLQSDIQDYIIEHFYRSRHEDM